MLSERISALWLRSKALVRRRQLDRDLDEELQFHLAMREQKLREQGVTAEEAPYAARRQFGNATRLKESSRELWGFCGLENFAQDLRYGLRILAKNPGFLAVAVMALALGIGANTVIFSGVNAMLLHPFAFEHLDRIVAVWESAPKQDLIHIKAAPANFRDWREQNRGFDRLAAGHGWDVNLTGAGVAERVEGYQVTADFFPLLGMPPQLGRPIRADDFEAGHTSVVVLSFGFWQRHLGGDPGIVGKSLHLNGQEFTVIGIMPADFDYPVGAEAWAPLDLGTAANTNRADHYLQVIGRLKPGTTMVQAQADLETIAARLAQQFPPTNAGHGVSVVSLVEDLTYGSRQFLGVLMGAAAFVLLLACANVANLQLARATVRQKELAVRLALGASRWRITRQLLVESVVLALLGGVVGGLLGAWGSEVMRQTVPPFILQHIPGIKHIKVDFGVLVFTLVVTLLTGILAGLAPALHFSNPDPNEALKEGVRGGSANPGRQRLRALLVVTEVALALVLLVGTGLMVKGFHSLLNAYPGFDRTNVLTFRIALAESKARDKARVRDFYAQVIEKLQVLPGVDSAAAVTSLPSGWGWNWMEYTAEGRPPATPGEMRVAVSQSITPDFFRALRIPLLKGRLLTTQDGPDAVPVMVISQSLARRIWPRQDPLGKRLRFGRAEGSGPWETIVGVVGDIAPSPFDRAPEPTAYFPFAQLPAASSALVVRTSGDPLALAAEARAQVRSVDADQPPYDMRTLAQLISDDASGVESSARMMFAFGIVALVLSASGIYALMTYSVTQRTHEIGVRMALGAQPGDVLRLVVGYAVKLTIMGLAIGVPCAVALTHTLSSMLFGVVRIDAPVFALFTLLLALVAAVAAYIPAHRATKVDPMVALRYE
jgi:putative ABC transport system permease protein